MSHTTPSEASEALALPLSPGFVDLLASLDPTVVEADACCFPVLAITGCPSFAPHLVAHLSRHCGVGEVVNLFECDQAIGAAVGLPSGPGVLGATAPRKEWLKRQLAGLTARNIVLPVVVVGVLHQAELDLIQSATPAASVVQVGTAANVPWLHRCFPLLNPANQDDLRSNIDQTLAMITVAC